MYIPSKDSFYRTYLQAFVVFASKIKVFLTGAKINLNAATFPWWLKMLKIYNIFGYLNLFIKSTFAYLMIVLFVLVVFNLFIYSGY